MLTYHFDPATQKVVECDVSRALRDRLRRPNLVVIHHLVADAFTVSLGEIGGMKTGLTVDVALLEKDERGGPHAPPALFQRIVRDLSNLIHRSVAKAQLRAAERRRLIEEEEQRRMDDEGYAAAHQAVKKKYGQGKADHVLHGEATSVIDGQPIVPYVPGMLHAVEGR